MPFPALQLPLYRFAEELGLALPFLQHPFDALQGAFGEAGAGRFMVDLGASSRHGIYNRCYHKLLQAPYLLLASIAIPPELMLSLIHRQRRRAMQVIAHPLKPGFWTILSGGSIYGCYDRRELAIAVMCSR